jgi:hypothetical protein
MNASDSIFEQQRVLKHGFAISRPDTPELCHLLPALLDQRAQGMPGARCARKPRVQW